MKNLLIGSHVSFQKEKQLLGSVEETLSYGGNCFMIYTGAPQNTARQPINQDLTKQAYQLMKKTNIDPNHVVVHAPYIVNLANGSDFAVNFLKQEVTRLEELGLKYLVLHPGSYVKLTKEEGINNIVKGLNKIITKDQKTFICLEIMAGKGTEIGTSFLELKQIIDKLQYPEKIKICLDTCHLNDAGYDIANFDLIIEEIENVIGENMIACIHINDSKNEQGSHKDRHENLGFGNLGFDNLINIIYHSKLESVPKILETPYVSLNEESKKRLYPPYKFEIKMIKTKQFDPNLLKKIRQYYH